MLIEQKVLIHKSIDEAWQVLGKQFAHAHVWASAVHHSEGSGHSFNGASCSERGCSTSMGGIKEKLTQYSDAAYTLAYVVEEGLPGMVKKGTNFWQLTPNGSGKCTLTMRMEMELQGFTGWVMQPMMQWKMAKMCRELAEDFKHYVEQGVPHPRKLKAAQQVAVSH